jgi:hypothetical protein
MKKIILIIAGVVICSCMGGKKSTEETLRAYYNHVGKAEDHITKARYDSAVAHYSKAFAFKEQPFADDLHNALVCEAKSSEPSVERCREYCSLLWKVNVWSEHERFGMDADFFASLKFRHGDVERPLFNQEASIELYDILYRDTKVSEKFGIDKQMSDSANKILQPEITRLKKLSEKVNIFDERVVGAAEANGAAEQLMRQWGNDRFVMDLFKPAMLKSIREGALEAYHVGDIKEWALPYSMHEKSAYGMCYPCCFYTYAEPPYDNFKYGAMFFPFDSKNPEHLKRMENIDKRRKELYLPDMILGNTRHFNLYWCNKMRSDIKGLIKTKYYVQNSGTKEEGVREIQEWLNRGINVIYIIGSEDNPWLYMN